MQSINLRPMILAEAIVNNMEKKIIITSEEKLDEPDLLLAVMGARNFTGNDLIEYEVYENGTYVAKVIG